MGKDTYYFSHDYNSRNDSKIKKLLSKHGYLGYGIFWAIIEDLYNNANVLQLDYDTIAFDLRTDKNLVKNIINDFDLFIIDGDNFGSLSIQNRIEERNLKSIKSRESANKRWNKDKNNTNALPSNYEPNAIKESIVKENKEKETNEIKEKIEERKLKFADTLKIYIDKFGREVLLEFYAYWTEPNKSNTKFRQELEKTWDLERRLTTWIKNDKNFNKKNDGTGKQTNSDRNKSDLIDLVEMARANLKGFEMPNS